MRVFVFIVALVLAVPAVCLDSKLLSPAELSKRIRMAKITSFSQTNPTIRTLDFLLRSSMDEPLFTLHGRDISGKPWRVILDDAARGAWRSDRSGVRTYYFTGYTGGAGIAPYTWILVLSFDDRKRPVPFFVTTHGGYDDQGPEDVLDLDGTGPQLLQQDYWRSLKEDTGYYVTALYQQHGLYWYRSDGAHGQHIFPTFEEWSVMRRGRPPVLVDHPHVTESVPDSSNDPAKGVHTKVVGVNDGGALRVSSEPQCKSVGFEVTVADTSTGRVIDLRRWGDSLHSAFYRLAKQHLEIVLTGLHQWQGDEECAASIAWAGSDFK